jgi:ferredoxin
MGHGIRVSDREYPQGHNSEVQRQEKNKSGYYLKLNKMNSIGIEASRCPQNHVCPVIRICPAGAISQSTAFSAPVIDEDKCTECGLCTNYCGYRAIQRKQ